MYTYLLLTKIVHGTMEHHIECELGEDQLMKNVGVREAI